MGRTKDWSSYFEVRDSPIAGKGVFAVKRIPQGAHLMDYVGVVVGEKEAFAEYSDPEKPQLLVELGGGRYLDPEPLGRPGASSYVNHSCDPNCEMFFSRDDVPYFVSTRAIEPGEELTFFYGLLLWNDTLTKYDLETSKCRCGSPKCVGSILNRKYFDKKGKPIFGKYKPKQRR